MPLQRLFFFPPHINDSYNNTINGERERESELTFRRFKAAKESLLSSGVMDLEHAISSLVFFFFMIIAGNMAGK